MSTSTQADSATADILATAVVPWTETGDFDEARFRTLVATLAEGLTRHLYVFGTAGEGYAVNDRQFARIARTFWDSSQASGVSPMLGIISLSLSTIIERIHLGRELGFRTFQLSLPAWGVLNDAELDRFFAETCGRFPDCAFHHYNLKRSGRVLTSTEYRRLAAAHPNLIAVKASTTDQALVADLLTISPRLRFYLTEIGYVIARRTTKDVGLLISLASMNFGRAQALVTGSQAEREAAVADFEVMTRALRGVAGDRFHMDGAFDKMIARAAVSGFPLALLPPYAGATEKDYENFCSQIPPKWRPEW